MSDSIDFNWEEIPEAVEVKREIKRDRPEEVPAYIVKLAQSAYDAKVRRWQELPDKPVAALFLTLIRAAGDHTSKDGQPHPTTVLAKLAEKDANGKDIAKSKLGKVVMYSVTERRGQKASDGSESQEGNGESQGDES
jgi:hypothetical protein